MHLVLHKLLMQFFVNRVMAFLPARRSHRVALGAAIAISSVMTMVGVAFSRPAPVTMQIFEVRVIDDAGHPVAGAEVRMGKQELGVTDSFGIWRRSVRTAFDSDVEFDIVKRSRKADGQDLVAKKLFALGRIKSSAVGDLRMEGQGDRQKRGVIKGSVKMEPARL
jgi:hypothetical protein